MKTVTIDAMPREDTGKGSARSSRREGRIPGVVYGQGTNIPLSIDRRNFIRALIAAKGENLIFDLTFPGKEPMKAIAREIQHHPVSRSALHVDFQHIDMSKPIHISVVVNLIGEPEGVKTFGGILEQPARTVEVSCLPDRIPSSIEMDVSQMLIGDSLHLSDLPADGIEFLEESLKVVAHVAQPTVDVREDEEEGEGAEGEGAEGEGDEKAEDGDEAKGDGGKG